MELGQFQTNFPKGSLQRKLISMFSRLNNFQSSGQECNHSFHSDTADIVQCSKLLEASFPRGKKLLRSDGIEKFHRRRSVFWAARQRPIDQN